MTNLLHSWIFPSHTSGFLGRLGCRSILLLAGVSILLLGGLYFSLPPQLDPHQVFSVPFDDDATVLAYSPDEQLLATVGETTVHLRASSTGAIIQTLPAPDCAGELAFSPDGTYLVSANHGICIWNLTKKTLVQVPWNPQAAIPPEKRWPASPGGIPITSPEDQEEYERAHRHDQVLLGYPMAVAFSPDSTFIIIGGNADLVAIVRADTGEVVDFIQAAAQIEILNVGTFFRHVALSPDNRWLLTSNSGEGLKLWDRTNHRLARAFLARHTARSAWRVTPNWGVFSADSTQITVFHDGSSQVTPMLDGFDSTFLDGYTLWSVTGDPIMSKAAAPSPVRHSFFSGIVRATTTATTPDGKLIAQGGGWDEYRLTGDDFAKLWHRVDARIVVWQTAAQEPAYILRGHQNSVTALAFSPDGAFLASLSRDKTLRLWRLDG